MSQPGIMSKFRMTAIAAVDSPAQKGARMAIMKRDTDGGVDDSAYEKLCKRTFTPEFRKAAEDDGYAMPQGRYPIENAADLKNAVQAAGRGKGAKGVVKAHIARQAQRLDAMDELPADWMASKADLAKIRLAIRKAEIAVTNETVNKFAERIAKDSVSGGDDALLFDDVHSAQESGEFANAMLDEINECYSALSRSVSSILYDGDASARADLLQTTFQQFKDAIQDVVPEALEPTIAKALGTNGSSENMTKAIAKSLGLAETATEAEVLAKLAENEKIAKRNEAIAKMSPAHRAFMEKADAAGQDAFIAMDTAKRDEAVAKAFPPKDKKDDEETDDEKAVKKGDAFRADDGTILRKKDFGSDAGFNFAKSMAAKAAANADALAKSEDQRLTAEFSKRAEPLKCIGKSDEVGSLLHDVAKFDAKLADRVEAVLKSANDRIEKGNLLAENGSSRGGNGSALSKAAGQIETLARDLISKEPELFKRASLDKMAAARAEVRKRNPDLAKQEQTEAKEQRAA